MLCYSGFNGESGFKNFPIETEFYRCITEFVDLLVSSEIYDKFSLYGYMSICDNGIRDKRVQ